MEEYSTKEEIISQILKDNHNNLDTISIETATERETKFSGFPMFYKFTPVLFLKIPHRKEYSYKINKKSYASPDEELSMVCGRANALEIALEVAEEFKKSSEDVYIKINGLFPKKAQEVLNLYHEERVRIQSLGRRYY